jgi:hypothetical protein
MLWLRDLNDRFPLTRYEHHDLFFFLRFFVSGVCCVAVCSVRVLLLLLLLG